MKSRGSIRRTEQEKPFLVKAPAISSREWLSIGKAAFWSMAFLILSKSGFWE